MTAESFLGRPWYSVKSELESCGFAYLIEMTKPPFKSKLFPLAEDDLYVLRVRSLPEQKIEFTLAARCQSKALL